MASRQLEMQTFSLEGEVVEIHEEHGQRLAKIVFTEPVALAVSLDGADGIHLGDRVAVHGWMRLEKEAS